MGKDLESSISQLESISTSFGSTGALDALITADAQGRLHEDKQKQKAKTKNANTVKGNTKG